MAERENGTSSGRGPDLTPRSTMGRAHTSAQKPHFGGVSSFRDRVERPRSDSNRPVDTKTPARARGFSSKVSGSYVVGVKLAALKTGTSLRVNADAVVNNID